MKKIAIDTVFLNRRYSGISIVWYTLLKSLRPQGYEIVLFKREDSYLPREILKKYKVISIRSFQDEFSDIPYVNYLCLANGINYFISTYYTYSTMVPCIVYVHDMIPEIFGYDFRSPMWAQKARCLANGKNFVCVSWNTKKDFERFYPNKQRSHLNYNALDTERFNQEDDSIIELLQINKPFFILIATNTDVYKNSAVLIRLFNLHPSLFRVFNFVCLSDKFDQNLGIKWAPKVSEAQLTSLYQKSIGLIQPSLYEGFGLPVIEAMYHRKNVLACDNSAISEIGLDNCVYFDPKDSDDLHDKIYEIHNGEHEPKKENGYKRAVSFCPESQVEEFNQIVNKLT